MYVVDHRALEPIKAYIAGEKRPAGFWGSDWLAGRDGKGYGQ